MRREWLDTDAEGAEAYAPTAVRTDVNRHEVDFAECGGHYYVDDVTYDRIQEALPFDPSNKSLVCDDCEVEYADFDPGR